MPIANTLCMASLGLSCGSALAAGARCPACKLDPLAILRRLERNDTARMGTGNRVNLKNLRLESSRCHANLVFSGSQRDGIIDGHFGAVDEYSRILGRDGKCKR